MPGNLAFGILSSRESPGAVGQLIDALGPRASVWIHHDPSKGPRPAPGRRDVRFVPRPVATGWGEWSLCEAILATLRAALAEPGWRYFQLLSGSCLPVRPIEAFEEHVLESGEDAHVDAVALDADEVALMSHGFRGLSLNGTLGHRVLRRLRTWHLGDSIVRVQRDGLSFPVPAVPRDDGRARVARAAMRRLVRGPVGTLGVPFAPRLRCWVGSTWWGASRAVCEYIAGIRDDDPVRTHFRRVLIPDEFYFQTLLCNAGIRRGRSNHWISRFEDAHPRRIGLDDLDEVSSSGRFFARKFGDDPNDPARMLALARAADGPVPVPPPLMVASHRA
jgi:hypothetical protein